MVDTSGKEKRGKATDRLLLIVAGLLVVTALTAVGLVMEHAHISLLWMLATGSAVGLYLGVGWGYRRHFRSLQFCLFFGAWAVVHAVVCVLTLYYLGLFYYFPIMVLELWVGYAIAVWRFGPPPDPRLH